MTDAEATIRDLRQQLEAARADNKQLRTDLSQARLDLMNSDAIRGALVRAATEQAGDMHRSLELLEAAFHEGADFVARGDDAGKSVDQAFREWTQENLSRPRKPTNQEPS